MGNPSHGSNSFGQVGARLPRSVSLARTEMIFDRATFDAATNFFCEKGELRDVFSHFRLRGGAPSRFLVERVRETV